MTGKRTAIAGATNGGESSIMMEVPYVFEAELKGSAPFLFHRWNCEAVAEKAASKKGSASKKTDDLESYVYRSDKGELAIPGEYVRQSIIHAAKYHQDPRSPRKSAMDLVKAGVVSLTELASLGVKDWDYEDKRRVVVQRNGVTRVRPAMSAGWEIRLQLQVLTPEYISETLIRSLLEQAGRLIGIGDFRPTYGRFQLVEGRIL